MTINDTITIVKNSFEKGKFPDIYIEFEENVKKLIQGSTYVSANYIGNIGTSPDSSNGLYNFSISVSDLNILNLFRFRISHEKENLNFNSLWNEILKQIIFSCNVEIISTNKKINLITPILLNYKNNFKINMTEDFETNMNILGKSLFTSISNSLILTPVQATSIIGGTGMVTPLKII